MRADLRMGPARQYGHMTLCILRNVSRWVYNLCDAQRLMQRTHCYKVNLCNNLGWPPPGLLQHAATLQVSTHSVPFSTIDVTKFVSSLCMYALSGLKHVAQGL